MQLFSRDISIFDFNNLNFFNKFFLTKCRLHYDTLPLLKNSFYTEFMNSKFNVRNNPKLWILQQKKFFSNLNEGLCVLWSLKEAFQPALGFILGRCLGCIILFELDPKSVFLLSYKNNRGERKKN